MCTSLKYQNYMGRNFDYEISYKEKPRKYDKEKYNMFGIVADIIKDYPLYYDAMNECGLCIAGLNFEGNAYYQESKRAGKKNITPWELPVKILGNCRNINEAKQYLKDVSIYNKAFNEKLPNSPLHWFICDKDKCITVEPMEDGLKVYDNEFEVLTNNPPFDKQKIGCNILGSLKKKIYTRMLPKQFKTRGVETVGLNGDLTSMGRFKRVYYFKEQMKKARKQAKASDMFHLLDSVKQPYGATPVKDKFEYTIYEVVYDMKNGTMHIRHYEDNPAPFAFNLNYL